MEHNKLQATVDEVVRRLFIPAEASGRHVHVTKEQAQILFGHSLTPARPLSQPGQFLAQERVTVKGPKGEMHQVAVLGPERRDGQVEISLTDGRILGIAPPVRLSGDIQGTPAVEIIGQAGKVQLKQGVICAQRHIHMTPEDGLHFGLRDGQRVKLQVFSQRPVIFEDVVVRIDKQFATAFHMDYDEANGCGFEKGDLGRILL